MDRIQSVAIGIRNINTKSGLGKIVLEQIKHYLKDGISITIYTSKYDKMIKDTGVRIVKIPRIPLIGEYYQRLFFARRAEKKIDAGKYDLVIGHGDLIHQDIIFLHNLVEKAYLLTHDKPMNPLNNIAKIRRLILKEQGFKGVVANSELMKNELITSFGIPEKMIKVIYPGFDPEQFNTNTVQQDKVSSRVELGIDDNATVIGFITSGDFKKRALALFIEALDKIETDIDYKVLLVGKDNTLPHYLEMIRGYGLEKRFIIKEPIDDVQKYFHAVDFTVHPAYFEEFGMVVQEAMACGLPVITSKLVGASEIMQDQSTVMESPNLEELTIQLNRLINNTKFRQNLASSSMESVVKTTWDDYINNVVHFSTQ